MLINGSIYKKKLQFIVEEYSRLISSGEKEDEILVITLNPYKKALFIKELKKRNSKIKDEKIMHFCLTE